MADRGVTGQGEEVVLKLVVLLPAYRKHLSVSQVAAELRNTNAE